MACCRAASACAIWMAISWACPSSLAVMPRAMACCSDRASCSCCRERAELAASKVEAVADDGDDDRMEGMDTNEEGVLVAVAERPLDEEGAEDE